MKYINSYKLFESSQEVQNIIDDIKYLLSDFYDNGWDLEIKYYKTDDMTIFNPFYIGDGRNESGGFTVMTDVHDPVLMNKFKESLLDFFNYCDRMNFNIEQIEVTIKDTKKNINYIKMNIYLDFIKNINETTIIRHLYVKVSTSKSSLNQS